MLESHWNWLLIAAAVWGIAGSVGLLLRRKRNNRSFEHTDPETMLEPAVRQSKFNEQCTLLSKECRGGDLWIVFIDEHAQMQEELHFPQCDLCLERL